MRNEAGTIDWERTEERAKQMTKEQLEGALRDIRATLPYADEMDLVNDTTTCGGYYRDEASVYYRELAERAKDPERWTPEDEDAFQADRTAIAYRGGDVD